MKVIGITGSSGSGKTTLSKILNERDDVKVINADKVVRELSVPGTEYLNAIKETFGQDVFLEDGNLNRKELARKIYNDNVARENLNKLTFNYVVKEIIKRIEMLDKKIKLVENEVRMKLYQYAQRYEPVEEVVEKSGHRRR